MALKILGQVSPVATTATTAYTVPAASSTVISSLVVNNSNTTSVTVRVAVRPAGAALDIKHYIMYDYALAPFASEAFKIGISLAATDVVTVYASATNVSFSLFGTEN